MSKIKLILIFIFLPAVIIMAVYTGAKIVIPNTVDLNEFKTEIFGKIEKETGFKIENENIIFERGLSPNLKLRLYHTLVYYPDSSVFLKLKDANVEIKLLPLLFKRVELTNAKFTRPVINTVLYKDLTTSLEKYAQNIKQTEINGFKINPVISNSICENYKLKIFDETINRQFYLEGKELVLKDVKLNDSVHFILEGALFGENKEYLKYNLDIVSSLEGLKNKFTFSPFKSIYNSQIKGNVDGKIIVAKDKNIKGNLAISDISLKADNSVFKNNDIKLVFSGDVAEIIAFLHTSESDVLKAAGKFNFGNKKYIDLKISGKDTDLNKLNKIINLIAESLNIKNIYKDVEVSGLLNSEFSLNSDFKKLKSAGKLELINVEVKYPKLPYKLNKINSKINFENNKINIEEAIAFVNNTPVNVSGVINEDVSLDLKINSENINLKDVLYLFNLKKYVPLDIENGKISFSSQAKGKYGKNLKTVNELSLNNVLLNEKNKKIRAKIKDVSAIVNTSNSSLDGEISINDLKTEINKNNIFAKNAEIILNNNQITLQNCEVIAGTSLLNLNGSVTDYLKSPEVKLQFGGKVLSSDLANIISAYFQQPHKALGKIATKGEIRIKNKTANIKAEMNADENNYLSYLVINELLNKKSLLRLDIQLNGKDIRLNDISLSENEKTDKILSINGGIKTLNGITLNNIKVKVPDKISIFTDFLGGEEISFGADLLLNGLISTPDISGNIKIYVMNIKKMLMAIKNADIGFTKDNIRILAPDILFNTSKINMLADIEPKTKNGVSILNMELICGNVDVNYIYSTLKRELKSANIPQIKIKKGILTVNNLNVLDLKARDIGSDFTLDNEILKLRNINANAYGGSIYGDLNYDLRNDIADMKISGENIAMKDSLYDLCKLEDKIGGKVDFNSMLSLQIGKYENALKSLSGKIDFFSRNGKMGMLGKFEYYLYAQNIFYHGLLRTTLNRIADTITKDKTEQYGNAEGTILFQNGYMITDGIKTNGKNMSLNIKGRHNMLSDVSNIDIYGRITDEITKKLGSFGDFSISEFVENPKEKYNGNILFVNPEIIDNIPLLYNSKNVDTKTFKVNICGKRTSLGSINSFMWLLPKQENNEYSTNITDISDKKELMPQDEILELSETEKTSVDIKEVIMPDTENEIENSGIIELPQKTEIKEVTEIQKTQETSVEDNENIDFPDFSDLSEKI